MSDQVQDLIAKKNFSKAVEVLRAQSQAKPHDRRLRLQLADVYVMAGQDRMAIPVLMTLADQEASDGFAAKAIAILKRIEKIEPGRRDVEERMAKMIQDKSRRTLNVPKPANLPPISSSGMSFGFEEIDSSNEIELGVSAPAAEAIPSFDPGPMLDALPAPEPFLPPPAVAAPAAAPPQELVAEFDDSFAVEPEAPAAAPAKPGLSTPLFDGFSPDELVAVMRGLELVSFEAGDVIVAEGAAGDSMFILTTGRVKAYVKTPKGRSMKVQEFEEGDFFGEIAVLTGKPRTATLTAAVDCECLVLNRATLDEITQTHPGVREVLKKFQKERALSTVQAIMADKG
ncbi:MAG: cyclic nucleotide-binding domain-containing protein [Vicinamibacteria bacterium]|nr:cyclic nucleotide-binding domain-containing protein [Vicinamibacteria bacterium]